MANKLWIGGSTAWSTAGNWSPAGVPIAGDNVRIPAGNTFAIASGLNQSAVALGQVVIEEGYTQSIGVAPTVPGGLPTYMQVNCTSFLFAGSGQSFFDFGAAALSPQIRATAAAPGTGQFGLYLKGSGLAIVSILGGSVGIAANFGETATIGTALRLLGSADVLVGGGVGAIALVEALDGELVLLAPVTTLQMDGGDVTTDEAAVIGTIALNRGNLTANAAGTITNLTLFGGLADFLQSGIARAITNLKNNGGALRYDPAVVAITNRLAAAWPVQERAEAASL